MNPILCAALTLLAFASSAQAQDPLVFTDPKDDPFNPLRYIANNTLSAIAISLVLVVALIQSWMMFRLGGRCMLAMLIGEFTWAVGFGTRFGLHTQPDSQGIYIAYYLFIVLSPCAFIASEYMLLGRLARYLKSHEHLLIRPQRITVVFVVSDVSTFLIQAAGALLSISKNLKLSKTGEHIFLAGLVLQLASFAVFVIVALRFLFRIKTMDPHVWTVDGVAGKPWHRDWRTLALVLIISSVGILIRCVYRVIELSQGYRGHLATTEAFFYGLDSLPLFIAVAVYTPFWPGRMIPGIDKLAALDKAPTGDERSSAEVKD
ncbi:RTA1-like protein [Trametes versicolor FP-101664 SS1]|uniref:RTA1-like protein n=1 Tax=Trametes versicolor (strain FP-101664) TaxID=717944 RepID=UPI0004621882|nr:RTA1-like protein [Trametes versicolor FP-101664 SS1]EIW64953.1 RTA1-like protein [Trametes versicolor FP-101664 SS1]